MRATVTKLKPNKEPTSEYEMISPELATKYLESNTQNRPLSRTTVEALAGEMTSGHWRLNHQGIAFDVNGILRDGQHRLEAIVLSGKTVQMMVTRGVGEAVFDTIDAHRPRLVGDQLNLVHGFTQGRRIAATAMVINNIEKDQSFGKKLPIGQTMDVYARHKKGIDFALAAIEKGPFSKAPIVAPIALAFRTSNVKATTFAEQVRDGENLKKGDPAHTLRHLIINANGLSSAFDRRAVVVAALRCLHAHFMGETIGVIRWNQLVDSETYAHMRTFFLKAK